MRGSLVLVLVTWGCATGGSGTRGVPPEARPVAVLIEACHRGDVALLKTVFSARMRERFERSGWRKELQDYTKFLEHRVGTTDPYDFTYEVDRTRDPVRVQVWVHEKESRDLSGIQVILQDGAWRMDER